MMVWLRPEYILAFVTIASKTYDRFWCATEEGHHQISCSDERALLTDISIRKVYRRTGMCEPDDHSEYLVNCQAFIDGSSCEGNKTCSIEISSRDYVQCGDKSYAPTYFFVQYTCIQIHTMCTDTMPIRNTLYGYILSPAYPHPMGDNLTCSMTIEAESSMYIELSPIQIRLQETIKCRSEFIEILGYDSSLDDSKNLNWKGYHTWCGADRSLNNPLPNARYLISSNSLYISLRTSISKKPRFFKIRYKIVPATTRSQYNSDGLAIDSIGKGSIPSVISVQSSTTIIPTTIIIPSLNESDIRYANGTITTTKRFFRKEVIIGIIAGIIALLSVIAAGIIIFIFIKRRRSSAGSSTGKKSASATTSSTASKPPGKSSDKAPLLEQKNNPPAAAAKQKLVPERTVPAGDTSRFKANDPTGAKAEAKAALTAADSGIYGADTSEEPKTPLKPASLAVSNPAKPATTTDVPVVSETKSTTEINPVSEPVAIVDVNPIPEPIATIVDVNPASEPIGTVVVNPLSENTTISAIVIPNNVEINPLLPNDIEEKRYSLDNTIHSAYSNLIDATTSENEGTTCGSGLQSRRTSHLKQPLVNQESNNIETVVISEYADTSSHNTVPFNPLHVILKKDAHKYYTTEYI
ncbi:unnamed protein product [Adineta steineri]|uniref:CUB domain-containing protein n=1 Tax=Adineta steineri TaxID=433720 RepID=A0A814R766_9BILA|nr:unnamed protein product [Adineta steineri]CAF3998627.1 unnamed protein product [Adineta steineri]